MKKILNILLAISLVSVTFYSCNDDDDDDKSSNKDSYLKVEDTEYSLSFGILEYWGEETTDGPYYLDLYLAGGFTLTDDDDDYTVEGEGNVIYFELYSSNSTSLTAGEYTYDTTSYEAFTFDYSDYLVNYNLETDEYDEMGEISSGTIDVSKDGSTYKISIDCMSSDGTAITGYFEGTLDYYDFSEEEISSSSTEVKKKKSNSYKFKKIE